MEQISFEATRKVNISIKVGWVLVWVLPYENLLSTAERRALRAGVDKTTLRLSDFMGLYLPLQVK
jgi:magnesium chelatase subunit I